MLSKAWAELLASSGGVGGAMPGGGVPGGVLGWGSKDMPQLKPGLLQSW